MNDLVAIADARAWAAAERAVRIAPHGHKSSARKRLAALVKALLKRERGKR